MSHVDKTLMNQLLTDSNKLKIVLTKDSVLSRREVAELVKTVEERYGFKVLKVLNTSLSNIYLFELTNNKKIYIDSSGKYMFCGFIMNMDSNCILDNMLEEIKGAGND